MTRCDRSRSIWFLTAASLLAGAVVACSDGTGPTAPTGVRAAAGGNGGGGGGGGGQKSLTIVALYFSPGTLAPGQW